MWYWENDEWTNQFSAALFLVSLVALQQMLSEEFCSECNPRKQNLRWKKKPKRQKNDSVMSTVNPCQAESSAGSVYRNVNWFDHSLRKQVEVQVCCSEWQAAWRTHTSDALIRRAGCHSTYCVCGPTSSPCCRTWSEITPPYIISCLVLFPHINRIIQETPLVSQHPVGTQPPRRFWGWGWGCSRALRLPASQRL